MFEGHCLRRFRTLLLLLIVVCAATVHAQEEMIPDEEFARKLGCPGFSECYFGCRDNYSDALDMCDFLDVTGFGTFCRTRAVRHFQDCATGCYVQCEGW
jgi:hypothetical protein